MSFSFSVACQTRTQREAILGFLQHVDWETLALEHRKWHGTELVSGWNLLYVPPYRREILLGFNTPEPNSLALAASAWLACRVNALGRIKSELYCDAKPMAVVCPHPSVQQMEEVEGEGLPADEQGVLTFAHESLLERGLSVLEHTRIRQVLFELSVAWPMGQEPPTPRQGRNRIGPRIV